MKGRSVLLAIVVLSCQFALNRTTAAQERNRPPAEAVADFERQAWRMQEGRLRIISDIDPERSRRTFDRTRWLLNTIEKCKIAFSIHTHVHDVMLCFYSPPCKVRHNKRYTSNLMLSQIFDHYFVIVVSKSTHCHLDFKVEMM